MFNIGGNKTHTSHGPLIHLGDGGLKRRASLMEEAEEVEEVGGGWRRWRRVEEVEEGGGGWRRWRRLEDDWFHIRNTCVLNTPLRFCNVLQN